MNGNQPPLRTGDAFLACHDLSKSFGATVAVDKVDLDVTQGTIFALLGPSGCGKTTLLRLIAGFEAPDAGKINLGGRTLTSPGVFLAPEKRKVAMVFQDFALFPHMDVAANLAFALPKGRDKRRRIGELLEMAHLSGLEKRMPHELSGGQQQRVALARAIAAEPALILLDEPFSNLDPQVRQSVRSEVRQLIRSAGTTAVFVTHDQEEALSLADQLAIMIEGRLLQIGRPADIYARPQTPAVARFIGDANFIPGQAHGVVIESELGPLHAEAGFTGAAMVMVRAEDLTLVQAGGVAGAVTAIDYFGHDQMVTVRLPSGRQIRVRLLAAAPLEVGQHVNVGAREPVVAFPSAI